MSPAVPPPSVYVIGFSFPVVPHGQARIRLQVSAAHNTQQIDQAIAAFPRLEAFLQQDMRECVRTGTALAQLAALDQPPFDKTAA